MASLTCQESDSVVEWAGGRVRMVPVYQQEVRIPIHIQSCGTDSSLVVLHPQSSLAPSHTERAIAHPLAYRLKQSEHESVLKKG